MKKKKEKKRTTLLFKKSGTTCEANISPAKMDAVCFATEINSMIPPDGQIYQTADFLIEPDPLQVSSTEFDFPKHIDNRQFCNEFCAQKLPKGKASNEIG